MTEDEAKTRWCPFARVGSEQTGLGSINRDYKLGELTMQAHCLGSTCAAWRWMTDQHGPDPENPTELVRQPRMYGFCGLAGAPY